ncbi:MAG: DUF1761 domain-containing protein [Paracoccaceae bacterium]
MEEITANVSWLAVIVGAVVSFIIGGLWYSPKVFGTKWAQGSGLKDWEGGDVPASAMVMNFIGLLLLSWFVSVTAGNDALLTVILATAAFTVLAMSGSMFIRQSAYARNANAGYWIVALVVMIICNGIF